MFHINKLSILGVTILISLLVITTVPSFAVDTNKTNASNTGSNAQPRDGAAAAAATASSSCFASGTLITLANRKQIPIEQLRSGDELLTTDGSTTFTTQMMMMLDKDAFSQAMFHTITTTTGHNVSLTELHLIGIIQNDKTIKYIPAKEVKIGDVLYVMSDGQLMASPVTNVIVEIKTGYYAPLTRSGTLLVNGIMASCYANVQSHEAAQFYMGPLRLYHWLAQSLFINKPFGYQEMDGMHFIPRIMYEFGRFFRPSTLRLT